MKKQDIQIRDPFVFPEKKNQKYYMFGSTDTNIWGKGTGFDVYIGENLENWQGPYPVFRPDEDFYSDENFWAPEVHEYKERYYMFATFLRKDNQRRGTAILVSDDLLGPFKPHSNGPVTPENWNSLDGTLFIDEKGLPWMVFCHEWVQVEDGEVCAMRLTVDLREPAGEPELLFRASEAPWPTSFKHAKRPSKHNFVTDGTYLFRTASGELLMLWASFVDNIYAQGISRSTTGKVTGPWVHDENPIYHKDGGHGMLFQTFDNRLMLTLHAPNKTPLERPVFIPIAEDKGTITVMDHNTN